MSVALITGASRGLGHALASQLAAEHWDLVIDAREASALGAARDQLLAAGASSLTAIAGDVSDPAHRQVLAVEIHRLGSLDLLVNNASHLGPSPQPRLADYPLSDWELVYAVNVLAPLGLTQLVLPLLRASHGVVVNISSDAAVEAYDGWGGYGSAKAALDHWTHVLAIEEQAVSVYSFDPGDMRTQMQQDAFPGEDISDRPDPVSVVPALVRLYKDRPPSGRHRAADLLADLVDSSL